MSRHNPYLDLEAEDADLARRMGGVHVDQAEEDLLGERPQRAAPAAASAGFAASSAAAAGAPSLAVARAPARDLTAPDERSVLVFQQGQDIIQRQHTQLGGLLRCVTRVEHFGMRPTPTFNFPKKSKATAAKRDALIAKRDREMRNFQEVFVRACALMEKANLIAHTIAGCNNAIRVLNINEEQQKREEEREAVLKGELGVIRGSRGW